MDVKNKNYFKVVTKYGENNRQNTGSITNRVGKIEKSGRITGSRNAVQGCNKFNSPASKNK